MTSSTLVRVSVLLLAPLLFAYAELGGNWFAFRMLERRTAWSVLGMVFFSVAYSVIAAAVAKAMKANMVYLMLNYGFAFAAIAIVLRLNWGKLPSFDLGYLREVRSLQGLLVIAAAGFAWSFYLLIDSPPESP